jgi:hypothetical protein
MNRREISPVGRDDKRGRDSEMAGWLDSWMAGWLDGETALIRFLIKKRAVVFIGEARENQLPISFRENSCNSWAKLFLFLIIRRQLFLFIPIRFLIEKPAVVFIGKARENQLPISFRENSC